MKLFSILILLLLLSACQAPFNERVKKAQDDIAASFGRLGYGPADVVTMNSVPQDMLGKKWEEKQVAFRDHCDRPWGELHQFFAHDAKYDFDYYLLVGESVTDIESIRWFQFKLDEFYPICRVAFIRKGRYGIQPREINKFELDGKTLKAK